MNNIIYAILPFLLFSFIQGILLNGRFSKHIVFIILGLITTILTVCHIVIGLASFDNSRLLSLMPLTAYMPMIITVFIISKRKIAGNLFTVFVGLISALIVDLLKNLYQFPLLTSIDKIGIWSDIICFFITVVICVLLGFIVFRFLRKIFVGQNVLDNRSWYIDVALFSLIVLSVYMENITQNIAVLILMLLVNSSVFAMIVGYLHSKNKNETLQKERAHIEFLINMERAEYRHTEQNLELCRRYRHDMRHHFAVLKGLIQKNNMSEAETYIETLSEQLKELSQKIYCKNTIVNAVLSAALSRAQANGVQTEVNVNIPNEIPLDSADICTILSNVVENAVNACMDVETDQRKLSISADYDNGKKFILSVKNSVKEKVPLGDDGFPAVKNREGHGYGLKSVRHIVEKYNGIAHCESLEHEFCIKFVLFANSSESETRASKPIKFYFVSTIPLTLILAILTMNFMPATIDSLKNVLFLGSAVEIIDFRNWNFGWGDSGIHVEYPQTNDDEVNKSMGEYISECQEKFLWYFERKYNGYVASGIASTILENDERMLVLSVECMINAGSSQSFRRYFVVDKRAGRIVFLSDLFEEGTDYNRILSEEIKRQIEWRVDENQDFFCEYGIFTLLEELEKAFFSLSEDTNFYIDDEGQLVFEIKEGKIAPNNMGTPSFTILKSVTAPILGQDGLLSGGTE